MKSSIPQRPFYPGWDDAFATNCGSGSTRTRGRGSRGCRRGQAGRGCHRWRPSLRSELLILDEPSTGLDRIVRRDILAAIIRTIAEEGAPVLFSSHLLDEVERMADWWP